MHPDWARGLRDQCQAAGVAFHLKQWGEWAPQLDEGASFGEFHGNGDWIDGCGCSAGTARMYRIGKHTAGRLLDGRVWNEFPTVTS
jgi:protein gp37